MATFLAAQRKEELEKEKGSSTRREGASKRRPKRGLGDTAREGEEQGKKTKKKPEMQRALWKRPAVLFSMFNVNYARQSVEEMHRPVRAVETSRAYGRGIKAAVKTAVAAQVAAAQERPELPHDKGPWAKAKKKDKTKGGKKGTNLLGKVGCRASCAGPRAHARAPWHAHALRAPPPAQHAQGIEKYFHDSGYGAHKADYRGDKHDRELLACFGRHYFGAFAPPPLASRHSP